MGRSGRMNDVVDLGGETRATAGDVGTVLAFIHELRTEQTVATTGARQLGRSDYGGQSAVEVLVADANLAPPSRGEADVQTCAHAAIVILGDLVVAFETAARLLYKQSSGRDEEAAGPKRLVEFGGKEVSAAKNNIVAQFTASAADIEHGETCSGGKIKVSCARTLNVDGQIEKRGAIGLFVRVDAEARSLGRGKRFVAKKVEAA